MHSGILQVKKSAWLFSVVLFFVLLVLSVVKIVLPLVTAGIHEGKTMYRHYSRKNDAQSWPKALAAMEKDIVQLDSLLLQIENRRQQAGGPLIDELYTYAAEAAFSTRKVEAGLPQQVGGYNETAVSIDGSGTYAAAGMLVEKIENSGQSTRIRQITITKSDTGACEIFIDVAIREEGTDVVR